METSFLWFGVFSGSFGVRSIVLCKCSGKYIDIYFKLKITYFTGNDCVHSILKGFGAERCTKTNE